MIERSEKLKSATEAKAAHLADRLVPWTFAGSLLSLALTRNVQRAVSVLMVDFSCALKLAMPLAVLSAMGEAGRAHITVKGGKFLEAVAEADTIVFDKTGTLTHACPRVARIDTFCGKGEEDMLRLAACLEEHFPHSMANAVVEEARRRGLTHEEYHSKVEYIVAHGVASTVSGIWALPEGKTERVLIGSAHFVFEDEKCVIPEDERARFDALPAEYSQLYLAIDGRLAAVISISDPLREEAREVLAALRQLGIKEAVMLTGDSPRTAEAIAKQLGVDTLRAGVLPSDKAEFVARRRAEGRRVIMVGDGINDSPALSEADCGIAISDGAAIAREIADVTNRRRQPLGARAPQAHSDGAHGADTGQLPLRHRLQRRAHSPRGRRHPPSRRQRPAAQPLHAGRQPPQHGPADRKGLNQDRPGALRGGLALCCGGGNNGIAFIRDIEYNAFKYWRCLSWD